MVNNNNSSNSLVLGRQKQFWVLPTDALWCGLPGLVLSYLILRLMSLVNNMMTSINIFFCLRNWLQSTTITGFAVELKLLILWRLSCLSCSCLEMESFRLNWRIRRAGLGSQALALWALTGSLWPSGLWLAFHFRLALQMSSYSNLMAWIGKVLIKAYCCCLSSLKVVSFAKLRLVGPISYGSGSLQAESSVPNEARAPNKSAPLKLSFCCKCKRCPFNYFSGTDTTSGHHRSTDDLLYPAIETDIIPQEEENLSDVFW